MVVVPKYSENMTFRAIPRQGESVRTTRLLFCSRSISYDTNWRKFIMPQVHVQC